MFAVSEHEFRECQAMLSEYQKQVVGLQEKIIVLYEEIRKLNRKEVHA
jgi:hypothetical protein